MLDESPGPGTGPIEVEAVVVGAGFGGLRMLRELRRLGVSAKLVEAGGGVGGTWYWNRYPGARTDGESWVYCFPDEEMWRGWHWSERFAAQPEVLEYLETAAEKWDLKPDILFDTRVESAKYDDARQGWAVRTTDGREFACTYFVTATGLLSVPLEPPFPGLERFAGEWYQTGRWPHEPVKLAGKRVGVVGTGASGVQIIPEIAREASQLTVFQRTANYVVRANNRSIGTAERAAQLARFDEIWAQANVHVFGQAMVPANLTRADLTLEQQREVFEAAWQIGGFQFMFAVDDVMVDQESNDRASDFIRDKIREIVTDDATAALLSPKGHPFGAKRPPLGHGYYETFNRDNVSLIDVEHDPIVKASRSGIVTSSGAEYELDVIVLATGFDAGTGANLAMDVRGREGLSLATRWAAGPETSLGIGVDGFPNLFMISGPQSSFANTPLVIENAVRFIGAAIERMRESGAKALEPTPDSTAAWTKLVGDIFDSTLLKQDHVRSWFTGSNVPGKKPTIQFHLGGSGTYFQSLAEEIESGFRTWTDPGSKPAPPEI